MSENERTNEEVAGEVMHGREEAEVRKKKERCTSSFVVIFKLVR